MTVETFTGSHQQNKCMLFPEKRTQFHLEVHAISLFHHLWINLKRGAIWEFFLQGKTPRFLIHIAFFLSIGDPNLCPCMFQTA